MLDDLLRPAWFDATLLDVVSGTLSLSTWTSHVVSEGLDTVLSDMAESLTVFAPSNDAFLNLDPSLVTFWDSAEGKDELRSTLSNHIAVGGPHSLLPILNSASSYPHMVQVSTLQGPGVELIVNSPSDIEVGGPVNTASLLGVSQGENLVAYNGLVHVIDQVLQLE